MKNGYLKKEYNIAETKKLLEEKLKNIPPENIESPEPYSISVMEILEYISILGFTKTSISEGMFRLTYYGRSFCQICL